jgi:membrane-bound serine protease (ClpP class)
VTSYGLLSIGGIISVVLGSMILVDSSAPEMQVSLDVVFGVALALAAILTFLARLAFKAQRQRSVTGDSGMIDGPGRALTPLAPGRLGSVQAHGEIWNAVAEEPIAEGEPVRVTAVDGLTLTVRRDTRPTAVVGDAAGAAGRPQTGERP